MNVLNRNTFRGEGIEGFFVDRVAGSPCDHRDSGVGDDVVVGYGIWGAAPFLNNFEGLWTKCKFLCQKFINFVE